MINFQPSEEQELLRQTLATFARDVVRPQAREADEIITPSGSLCGWREAESRAV